ncbi:complex I subunit 1/NuoH family protein [Natronobacterium texcoconense]|uniref:NADH dehydrogenase subunit H n=1 Tax=Natronobacterium texcoconense TaxID=1095778 RepID=A0A1H1HVP4_NATTX|nr:complex I subunit 1 family protein [Natronobacterium texcoconense]SDR29505.1 NADH dehydrogenase subunit H [Natronobacterium texcoconense]
MSSNTVLAERIGELLGLGDGLLAALVAAAFVATLILVNAGLVVWAKRKTTAAFTDRIAVTHLGPGGILIIVADAVRLLSKENIIPEAADRPAYDLAPLIVVFSALLGFAVIPMGSGIQIADPEVGLAFVFAISSLGSLGLVMAGYSSGNKFSLLGSLRAVATSIAYEIPLVVTGLSVVLFAGTLRTSHIVDAQSGELVALAGVAIPSWYAFVNPFAFVLFLAAMTAEVGRNPFDMAEAPSELVAGYQTEYSSVYFTLIYMGEFVHIFLGGAIVTTVFLGGPAGPGPAELGIVWFLAKIWAVFLFTQWLRSAVPRLRIDQFIEIGWKGLLVLSFGNLFVTAVIVGVLAG